MGTRHIFVTWRIPQRKLDLPREIEVFMQIAPLHDEVEVSRE